MYMPPLFSQPPKVEKKDAFVFAGDKADQAEGKEGRDCRRQPYGNKAKGLPPLVVRSLGGQLADVSQARPSFYWKLGSPAFWALLSDSVNRGLIIIFFTAFARLESAFEMKLGSSCVHDKMVSLAFVIYIKEIK